MVGSGFRLWWPATISGRCPNHHYSLSHISHRQEIHGVVRNTLGLENTLFMYASDNGGCKDSGGYNTPLRGGKHYLYEGGVRVPAFISGAGVPKQLRGTSYKPLFHVILRSPPFVFEFGQAACCENHCLSFIRCSLLLRLPTGYQPCWEQSVLRGAPPQEFCRTISTG